MAPSAAAVGMHMCRCRVRDARALLPPGPGCPRAADGSGCPRSSGPRIPGRRRAMDPTLPHLHQRYHRPPLHHGQAPQLAAAARIPQRPSASTVRPAPPACLVPFLLLDVKGRRSPTPMQRSRSLHALMRKLHARFVLLFLPLLPHIHRRSLPVPPRAMRKVSLQPSRPLTNTPTCSSGIAQPTLIVASALASCLSCSPIGDYSRTNRPPLPSTMAIQCITRLNNDSWMPPRTTHLPVPSTSLSLIASQYDISLLELLNTSSVSFQFFQTDSNLV